ncbi:unnamed protein product [Thlaspi arvense]|uniref:F-box domain-containing protein n=1 Tax=Thlaspi arvense TaxID=13288 RepID=A0AAU9S870_THLAR|nr:unnamed protein product [Thlaspi arvense]
MYNSTTEKRMLQNQFETLCLGTTILVFWPRLCSSLTSRTMSVKRVLSRPDKKKQSSLITLLPEDVIVDIIARVPRCDYPTLSLVSKHFRSLVASPELYARRSLLSCTTEHRLYVALYTNKPYYRRLYILRRKANGNNRLVLIPSLPAMPHAKLIVAVGSRIYMFGGKDIRSVSASTIDCRSHTVQPLPSMPVPMRNLRADTIDGRIYVIGWDDDQRKVMVVFNTETQKWEEPVKIRPNIDMSHGFVVMAGKLYTRNYNSFVYDPKENK